jgi:hypothetical protein
MTVIARWPCKRDLATGQRKRGVFRIIVSELEQPTTRPAVDDPADSGPVSRARTHRTRFGTGVQRRVIHPVVTQHTPRIGSSDKLRVLRWVTTA